MSDIEKRKDSKEKPYLSPYPLSRLAPAFDLVDLAREISKADDMLSVQTGGKLRLLADQIRALQEEAKRILQESKWNQELHGAECGFQKKVGKTYHLYRKAEGALLFSMISPDEWGERCPYSFVGSFKLENDMGWTGVGSEYT